ncbi:CB1 cannabinoid receptor-interacting protein 1-like [Artemia franciscana]|uniref:CB1 cannabinoid receptor-interacting protein 1 n=1 Tax=Artemia franciscana TaxID=6661 RepID=A0AA88IG92_ARTSF|nr:hypothetical protein QYM36_008158 [Artemia franciscana]
MRHFRPTISFRQEPSGDPVYCKVDGERFNKPKTIKLMTESSYRIDITLKPPMTLEEASFHGQNLELVQKFGDSNACVHSSNFNTNGLKPSKKKERETMVLSLKIKEVGLLQMETQMKLYSASSTQHCQWGTMLHGIEMECESSPESDYVKIIKEIYR